MTLTLSPHPHEPSSSSMEMAPVDGSPHTQCRWLFSDAQPACVRVRWTSLSASHRHVARLPMFLVREQELLTLPFFLCILQYTQEGVLNCPILAGLLPQLRVSSWLC